MNQLRTALERYVGMRQGLGYKYHGPARRLSQFVTFMEARGAETITTELAMEWVTLSMARLMNLWLSSVASSSPASEENSACSGSKPFSNPALCWPGNRKPRSYRKLRGLSFSFPWQFSGPGSRE